MGISQISESTESRISSKAKYSINDFDIPRMTIDIEKVKCIFLNQESQLTLLYEVKQKMSCKLFVPLIIKCIIP